MFVAVVIQIAWLLRAKRWKNSFRHAYLILAAIWAAERSVLHAMPIFAFSRLDEIPSITIYQWLYIAGEDLVVTTFIIVTYSWMVLIGEVVVRFGTAREKFFLKIAKKSALATIVIIYSAEAMVLVSWGTNTDPHRYILLYWLVFGIIFVVMGIFVIMYGIHIHDMLKQAASLMYRKKSANVCVLCFFAVIF